MEANEIKRYEFVLSKIEDGFIFERFATEFLSIVLGEDFIPVGGIHDKGIDGLSHLFSGTVHTKYIYQMSIEKDPHQKIKNTLLKLKNNAIQYDTFIYVTNQPVKDQDKFMDEIYASGGGFIKIYEKSWFAYRVNSKPGTIRVFQSFTQQYLHEFSKPGKSYEIGDLIDDPRLYVFLRQQWEDNRRDLSIDKILADTLILYSLEETDPDKKIFKSYREMESSVAKLIHFDPKQIYPTIKERLGVISKKPRRLINYHPKEKAYCLPYETRKKIQDRNLSDSALYTEFLQDTERNIKTHLDAQGVKIKNSSSLVENMVRQLYYQQGLEFSNFILKGENINVIEKNISDIVAKVVDESPVIIENRQKVKTALLLATRDIVYKSTKAQRDFLAKLSNTYVMLFMLQCDPKLATYFSALSSSFEIYVCTSIIIPALSEYHLEPHHRRHWSLLKGAATAGAKLIVDENIINETVSHFNSIKHIYKTEYENCEEIYLDELQMLYVDEIMIRAYFYAKINGKVDSFDNFLDSFINPDLSGAEEALIDLLRDDFGIVYQSSESLKVKIDKEEENILLEKLMPLKKGNKSKAKNDIRIILKIYALRERNNEAANNGGLGYRTWWLSKDTTTFRIVNEVFKSKYKISCYMRPDFLYNYISLAPTKDEVDNAYRNLFPSLIGANISFHLPPELLDYIHERIDDHKRKHPTRIKAILRELSEKLKYDAKYQTRTYVGHFLDEKIKEIENSTY